ncbi:cellulase family glycosylhydrolase [Sorangium sp. So ce1128]
MAASDGSRQQRLHDEAAITPRRKLRVGPQVIWEHHCGGWKYVVGLIRDHLHCDDGIRFIGSVDDMIFAGEPVLEPWVGVVHQVPRTKLAWFPDLERQLRHEAWLASKPHCRGLFVLSLYVKRFLIENGVGVPVSRVPYPAEKPERTFDFARFRSFATHRVLFIGEYLRDFEAFGRLRADGYEKVLLKPENLDVGTFGPEMRVKVVNRVPDDEYARLLAESVVFLKLLDAPANTTVIECLVRHTPLVVNRLDGVVEYLGEDYPLYYEDLAEAEAKLADGELLRAGHEHLVARAQEADLTGEHFLRALQSTAIYRSLPTPRSAEIEPRACDLSVIICSYKRVYNLRDILRAFTQQTYGGRFEILLWNNNIEERAALDAIHEEFKDRLDIKLIHSTENFYCIIRMAVASLMRSDLMLVCDDDVIPSPVYVATFVEKYHEYGPDAILCCRGHVFLPHRLDEEEPQRFWEDYEHLQFFDESVDDRQVQFLHADNCLIPKRTMLRALQYEMTSPEYALIDDYWLSFVFSHHLGVPIWKIKADHVMRMTPCADSSEIALFHNARVREQRVNFYVEHMRKGWPPSAALPALPAPSPVRRGAAETWERGFHGVNMHIDARDCDLEAASRYGIPVIRLGAVGSGVELQSFAHDSARGTWDAAITRLQKAIRRAHVHGLQVILSLNHLPGRPFAQSGSDPESGLALWRDPRLQQQAVALWGELARQLRSCTNVIGYDLINEPFLPDDVDREFFAPMSKRGVADLNELYARMIQEIRRYDPERMIILEPHYWASPLTFETLEPHADPNVAYSFHMYAPSVFTDRAKNGGKVCYPGLVPEYPPKKWAECRYWDRNELVIMLSYISDWQKAHGVPSSRIYVGEFGVCREVRGAEQYLRDLVSIFGEKKWSWTMYAFREYTWDAMDYELGTDMANMLCRSKNPLFDVMAEHFE